MEEVKIVEVGPRDGLQNEKRILSCEDKLNYIMLLKKSGLRHIEATSFVRPQSIPQMGDAQELATKLQGQEGSDEYIYLVPNIKGLEIAKKCGVKNIALFNATSDTFSQKNVNATVEQCYERIKLVAQQADQNNLKKRAYISTVFGCPYEGEISLSKVIKACEDFLKLGVYEISFGDTTGVATPKKVKMIIQELKKIMPTEKIAMHFHDTYGMAPANVYVALEEGVRIFDSSSGGLGGCPYAKGASGNLGTEDLIYSLESYGLKTGIDKSALLKASEFILSKVQKKSSSKVYSVMQENP